ncbi:LuxR C-terminal-related transcriptional regulator [Streptomyces sp. SP17BM10]|uniref:LuxR C-terminal-related transcriptional regulator n=1 Tax=Streptomyces sp. SP17BM10 TaxID=3002530 RepID=UPI002E75B39A|nr:LuxR C-terminal-related transcriptional regulator [Streptomyces sp. SP17BM10]MEE1788186.1 LuxR C-terminal-related transcriptional regulator [Streptomyces sp. SP17BM10]
MTAEPAVAPDHGQYAAGFTGGEGFAGNFAGTGGFAGTGSLTGAGEPDDAARRLYLSILAEGGRIPFTGVHESDHAALQQLVDIGLLMPNAVDACYTAVSPRSVTDRLGAELRSEATRLLVRAENLPGALDGLTRAYDAMPRRPGRAGGAVYVEGHVHIRQRISQLVSDCRAEVLTAQPGHRPADTLQVARLQDVQLLQRGCSLRTIYQPVAFADQSALAYADEVTRHGSLIRVLDEPFQRLIVFDRTVAVISASEDNSTAAFITDPAAITFLVGAFERDWARADTAEAAAALGHGPARSTPDRIGRLLARGLTQRAVATRLGLSERTVAAHISRLRDRYGAQTLFQLGWLMRGSRDDR